MSFGAIPGRARNVRAQCATIEQGLVHPPNEVPWLDDYLRELTSFPNSRHDDQVDSTTQAIQWFSTPSPLPSFRRRSWRRERLQGSPFVVHSTGQVETTMRKSEMIRARVEPALKKEAEAVLGRLGMTPTEAITVYYRQIALNRGLPFPVRIPNAATRKALRDADKGKLREWPDLDSLKKALT